MAAHAREHVTLNVDRQAVTLGAAGLLGRLSRELDCPVRYADLWPGFAGAGGAGGAGSAGNERVCAETVRGAFERQPELFSLFSPFIFAICI